jgi:hypothetical protein
VSSDPYLLDAREYTMLIVGWFYNNTGSWPDEDDVQRMRDGVRRTLSPSVWSAVSEVLLESALHISEDNDRREVQEWASELHDALFDPESEDESVFATVLFSNPRLFERTMRLLIEQGTENPLQRIVGDRLFESARVLCVTSRDLFAEGRIPSEHWEALYQATPEMYMGFEGWAQRASVLAKVAGVPARATRTWLGGLPPQVVCDGLGLFASAEQEIFSRLCEHDDVLLWDLAEAVRTEVAANSVSQK